VQALLVLADLIVGVLGPTGKKGVEMARSILKIELLRDMKLAGTPTLVKISSNHSMRNKHNENFTQIK
jgi:hypothetical protein